MSDFVHDLKRKAVHGVAWSAIENWTSQGMSFLVFLVLARLLGPADFGLVALASVYVTLVQMIIRQGFFEAIIQADELDDEHLDTAFWTNMGIALGLFALTLLFADAVGGFLGDQRLGNVVRVMSLLFPLSALSAVQQAILNREMRFKALAIRTFAAFGASGVTGIALAYLGWGVWSLVAQQVVYAAVNLISLWAASEWRPRWRFSQAKFQSLWGFGVHILGTNILDIVNKRADQWFVGRALGIVTLGYYAVAQRVFTLMMQLGVSTFRKVAAGAFSRLQKEPERLAGVYLKSLQISTVVTFPAFIGFAALAPDILATFFGARWLPAVPSMQLLMLLGIVQTVQFFESQVLCAMGKPEKHLFNYTINTIASFIIFLCFVRAGLTAMVAAFVVRGYVLAPLYTWSVMKMLPVRLKDYWRVLWPPVLASLVMGAALVAAKNAIGSHLSPLVVLALFVPIGAGIYAASLAVVRPELLREVWGLIEMLRLRRMEKPAS